MRTHLLFFTLLLICSKQYGQSIKKPLDHSVYDGWQSVASEAISDDGKWIVYAVTPQEGDARLVITERLSGKTKVVERGAKPRFTTDSKFVVFTISPTFKETRTARIKKTKSSQMPKDSLGLLNLASLSLLKFPAVKSFKVPEKGAGSVAWLSYAETDSTKKGSSNKKDNSRDEEEDTKDKQEKQGAKLTVYNLSNKRSETFTSVTEFCYTPDGRALAIATAKTKKDSTKSSGVAIYEVKTGATRKVSSGMNEYKNLAFDSEGRQLAFAAENEPLKSQFKYYKLYYYTTGKDSASVIATHQTAGVPQGWSISADGEIKFSKDGKKLFFGTAPLGLLKDTSLVDFEVAKVDIWNYKDDYIQPMQLKNLEKDQKRSYSALIYPATPEKVIQLGDQKMNRIIATENGTEEEILGTSDEGHRIETQWTGSRKRDIYLISVKDGSRRRIAENITGDVMMSPGGKFVVWYNRTDRNWYSYDIRKKSQVCLNKNLKINFYDETNDVPDDPDAYGLSAFLEDDKGALIYDRYDIWNFDLASGAARNLTNGYGRRHNIRLRFFNFEKKKEQKEDDNLPEVAKLKQPLYLDAFNYGNKYGGWYKTTLTAKGDPQLLTMGPISYSRPVAARDASYFIYKKENFLLSPDLYVSADFRKETRLSSLNPQQKNYNWGMAELIKWTTPKGHQSEGVLYKPENFDPSKKYPMIVYFYEKLTDRLYAYTAPAPTPSRLNISYFVSNGYLVFTPDISYETGHPGRSAEEYINSGVEFLKKNAWVDGSKIGIQGQSWGGYQVAHLITRTNMYAAAWAGAPVVNMTSAYGGIRWETGMNRQFQYEKTQSRIGATLWEKPELYIENSPLFHLPNVTTPVAIMANDADGAVPWYQGIEMFTALRRLGKPVWMLNYNNEAHNLVQRQNRKDIQRREQQFFDHFLKGAPMPQWMDRGVPAIEKGLNWGFQTSGQN